ncbi:pali-domain-containing protein [Trametes versicolor FP-101664 SS1]|uniref:pali-domain-containing protein n=1 Tax=Trametes versicolor (strain FP-101664) TaxID=717944 RepID=UPI000462325A|nr:pali-domain-containing protein [Trametes versicolor FP-101664 SS1]EIW60019.1 pali-domain-containing protein [Trametes versicolor FP-101664 SS1]
MLAAITPFFLFVAFLLLLLVSLSLPIIKSIFLFRLTANDTASFLHASASASGEVRFGVWGYCTSAITVHPHLGYQFDSNVANALHVSGFSDTISRTLSAVLVLHPIACALAFVALVTSLFITTRRSPGTVSRPAALATLVIALLAAVITTVIFLLDVIFVAVVRNKINDESDGVLQLNWGNAVWMALGATIALWASVVSDCAGLCGFGRRYSRKRADGRY